MVSMKTSASIALCMIFSLHVLVHADQGNEGYVQTSSNAQEKEFTPQEELTDAGGGKRIIGGRKMLVAKADEGQNGETSKLSDADRKGKVAAKSLKQQPPSPTGTYAQKEEWKAEETNETEKTGVMNLINGKFSRRPVRPKAPLLPKAPTHA